MMYSNVCVYSFEVDYPSHVCIAAPAAWFADVMCGCVHFEMYYLPHACIAAPAALLHPWMSLHVLMCIAAPAALSCGVLMCVSTTLYAEIHVGVQPWHQLRRRRVEGAPWLGKADLMRGGSRAGGLAPILSCLLPGLLLAPVDSAVRVRPPQLVLPHQLRQRLGGRSRMRSHS